MVFRSVSFPRAEVQISNVFVVIHQNIGALDSMVVHSSACSDLDLSLIPTASLVVSLGLASLAALTTSIIASNSVSLIHS